jgi:AraC-like DNA-binding protein
VVTPSSTESQEEWEAVQQSNPFAHLLEPLHNCKLNDFDLRIPLPLKQGRDHPAPVAESVREAVQLAWPDLKVVALVGTATTAELESSPWLSLIFVTAGRVCLHQGDVRWCAAAGSCLIVAGRPSRWVSTAFSVVCVMLPWQRLIETAAAMQSDDSAGPHASLVLASPISCKPTDGHLEGNLLALLDCTLRTISQLQESNPGLVRQLGLVEQIYRLIAALAFPILRHATKSDNVQANEHQLRDSFDNLIDYIAANLDQPLSLTTLAGRSNYSRRALQYAFRQRMGCTATQWIRARRLDLAHQQLQTGSPDDTVTSIAHACGYRSMGLFSIEFQQRFHIKPSQLLRTARSGHAASAEGM